MFGNQAPAPQVPGIAKTPVSHCGYTSLQGRPEPWECPGCGTTLSDHVPVPDPAGLGA